MIWWMLNPARMYIYFSDSLISDYIYTYVYMYIYTHIYINDYIYTYLINCNWCTCTCLYIIYVESFSVELFKL